MSHFSHLHVHSEKSFFDGIMSMQQIIKKTISQKMKAVSITDHHHIMGWIELEVLAQKEKIKPLFGIELNVNRYHITAFAKNEKGMKNLILLNNIGRRKNSISIQEKDLYQYKDDIFFLTGCAKGKLFQAYYQGGKEKAKLVLSEFQQIFKTNFAIELTTPKIPNELRNIIKTYEKNGIPIIPTNDCHYLEKEDNAIYEQNIWLRTLGKKVCSSEHRHFKSEREMLAEYNEKWVENTQIVTNICELNIKETLQKNRRNENYQIPLCCIEKFDDIESIKRVFVTKGEYRLAEKIAKEMYKKDLRLEDLIKKEEYLNEVKIAFGLRGKIKKIKPHSNKMISVNLESCPIFKEKRTNKVYSQWTEEDANYLEYVIKA